ncbi:MAG: hypothetical protein V1838_03015 [Patescibacteria group bacterium]
MLSANLDFIVITHPWWRGRFQGRKVLIRGMLNNPKIVTGFTQEEATILLQKLPSLTDELNQRGLVMTGVDTLRGFVTACIWQAPEQIQIFPWPASTTILPYHCTQIPKELQ